METLRWLIDMQRQAEFPGVHDASLGRRILQQRAGAPDSTSGTGFGAHLHDRTAGWCCSARQALLRKRLAPGIHALPIKHQIIV